MTRRQRIVVLPKRGSTLASKIVDDDPWSVGDELAATLVGCWDELPRGLHVDEFIRVASHVGAIVEFGAKHHLAPYHIMGTVVRSYL